VGPSIFFFFSLPLFPSPPIFLFFIPIAMDGARHAKGAATAKFRASQPDFVAHLPPPPPFFFPRFFLSFFLFFCSRSILITEQYQNKDNRYVRPWTAWATPPDRRRTGPPFSPFPLFSLMGNFFFFSFLSPLPYGEWRRGKRRERILRQMEKLIFPPPLPFFLY